MCNHTTDSIGDSDNRNVHYQVRLVHNIQPMLYTIRCYQSDPRVISHGGSKSKQ